MPLLLQFLEEFFHGELSLFCFSCVPVMSFSFAFLRWHPKRSLISRLNYIIVCASPGFRMWQNLPIAWLPFASLLVACHHKTSTYFQCLVHLVFFYHAHRNDWTKTGIDIDHWIGLSNNLHSLWVGKSSGSMSSNLHLIFHIQALV